MSGFPSFTKVSHNSPYADIAPSNPSLSASGKVIAITGGAGGIGRAIAAGFVEAGATAILLIGRTEPSLKESQAELARTKTVSVSYSVADITNPSAIKDAFSTAVERYGKIDVLVNNAGYLDAHKPFAESELDDYWHSFEVNIKGPIVTTQAFLKIAQPGATLINVSSAVSVFPSLPGMSGYMTSKLASVKLMEGVHHENPTLRVFNLHPGVVKTEMEKKLGIDFPSYDEPSLPAAFCVWLASPESEAFRGRFLWSSWDVAELKAREQEITENNLLVTGLNGWPPKN